MPIPDYQAIMLPLLSLATDGKEPFLRDAIEFLADQLGLTDEERREHLPSGRQAVFTNRVAWARTYLKQAGPLESTRRAYFKITGKGRQVYSENPTGVDIKYLERFPEFLEFKTRRKEKDAMNGEEITPEQTPDESLEAAYQKVRKELAQELLKQIKQCSPAFFENLVVDLLVKVDD